MKKSIFPSAFLLVVHLTLFTSIAAANVLPASEAPAANDVNSSRPITKDLLSILPSPSPPEAVHVATLLDSDLREDALQSPQVQRLLDRSLQLTRLNLNYIYGSSDPVNGGMDCSGTVYFLLNDIGLRDVPRDASEMYKWVWLHGRFNSVVSSNPNTFELSLLKPGDLLFWTGTYKVDRDPPVTHVMIYLGINRHTGHRVMMGASEGRRFNNKPQYGVSVFDFTLPGKKTAQAPISSTTPPSEARFIGYGSVPGLSDLSTTGVPK